MTKQLPTLSFFNTRTRSVEPLSPREPGVVSLYCCGPTVYHYMHIGNLRTYLFEDLLIRTLKHAGYTVNHVMNITDVGHLVADADEGEDKMAIAAKREKKKSMEIAAYYTDAAQRDFARLGLLKPTTTCRATDHIPEMIALIQRLEQRGFAYQAGGNVYFDVSKFPQYGDFARLNMKDTTAVARVDAVDHKRNSKDFALWLTRSKFENHELLWDSPWGSGYPGWHIECSAMSMKYLGEDFDIHCGGIDHVPLHHTNEIAQSEAAIGHQWVRLWIHGEHLITNSEKMAKSAGNFLTLSSLEEKGYEPMSYRYFLLGASYRTQLNFTFEGLDAAQVGFRRLRDSVLALKRSAAAPATEAPPAALAYQKEFRAAMYNDLNAPKAIALTWKVLGDDTLSPADKLFLVYDFDSILGLGAQSFAETKTEVPSEVQELANQRAVARKEKNWKESDRLRDEIARLGFIVEDKGGVTNLKKA